MFDVKQSIPLPERNALYWAKQEKHVMRIFDVCIGWQSVNVNYLLLDKTAEVQSAKLAMDTFRSDLIKKVSLNISAMSPICNLRVNARVRSEWVPSSNDVACASFWAIVTVRKNKPFHGKAVLCNSIIEIWHKEVPDGDIVNAFIWESQGYFRKTEIGSSIRSLIPNDFWWWIKFLCGHFLFPTEVRMNKFQSSAFFPVLLIIP